MFLLVEVVCEFEGLMFIDRESEWSLIREVVKKINVNNRKRVFEPTANHRIQLD